MSQDPTLRLAPASPGPWPFLIGLLLPVAGLVLGLIRAFDPYRKQEAGLYFGGAVTGGVLGVLFAVWGLPLLAGGAGGPAYQRGVEQMQAGNTTAAAQSFRAAATADPNLTSAWVNLAAVQAQQLDALGAEQSARRALGLIAAGHYGPLPGGESREQVAGMAHGNLAVALALQGRTAEAAGEARRALALYPDHPGAPNLQAIARTQ